jgi:hypothetical protein
MAYAGTGSAGSSFEGRREDLAETLGRIANHYTPVLDQFLDLRKEATNYKHEWVDKPLAGLKDSILAASTLVTAGGVVTVNGGTNTPKRYIDGVSIIRINSEYLLVTSTVTVVTNSRTLAVTRAQRSTTAVQHLPNSQVFIMNPRAESFESDRNDAQFGIRKYNLTRIFERQYGLSGTAQALNTPGSENTLKGQRLELAAELMKELQMGMFHGARYESGASRDMGGLYWWATQGGGNTTAAAGATLTLGYFDDIIENYANAGGDVTKMMMLCSFKQQRKINALKATRVVGAHGQNDKSINNIVETYDFNGKAHVKIVATTDVNDDELFILQDGNVKVIPLQGRMFKDEALAKTNDADKRMLVGEYTMEVRNVKETLYHYSGLAT